MRSGKFAELSAFAAVARARSFRRAAADLNLRPSTLSHSVKALEDRLGVKLLARTTRSVALTPAGAALLDQIEPALVQLDQATQSEDGHRLRPQGAVRISVTQNAAAVVIAPRLAMFAETYPDVELEVSVNDAFVDIVQQGFDAGIRLGESVGTGMTAVRVSTPMRSAVVASPDYWQRRRHPTEPHQLATHRCINRRYAAGRGLHRWYFARNEERIELPVTGPLVLDAEWLMREAALAGAGVALLAEGDVISDVASGSLVRVLEDWCPPIYAYYLYHPSHRLPSASLRAVITTLAVEAEDQNSAKPAATS